MQSIFEECKGGCECFERLGQLMPVMNENDIFFTPEEMENGYDDDWKADQLREKYMEMCDSKDVEDRPVPKEMTKKAFTLLFFAIFHSLRCGTRCTDLRAIYNAHCGNNTPLDRNPMCLGKAMKLFQAFEMPNGL